MGKLVILFTVVIGVYSLCDGPRLSRGPYLGITTMCSVSSLIYVSFKAPRVFRVSSMDRGEHVIAMEISLFICSLLLSIGHIAVAYRTSCRERRKLLVYKIDIEAVSLHLPSLSLSLDHDDVDDAHIAKL